MEGQERLKALKDKRENAEYEYEHFKKRFSETSEYNDYKRRRIERLMESQTVSSDPKIKEIYKERLELIREFQLKESEFSESYENGWRKLNEELDVEEREIQNTLEKDEENGEYTDKGNYQENNSNYC